MKSITVGYKESCGVDQVQLDEFSQQLKPEVERVKEAFSQEYKTEYASLNVPADHTMVKKVCEVVQAKKQLKPTTLVVIGIGGSNLGTKAVQEALLGRFYNEQQPATTIYYADTTDTDYIYDIILLCEQDLQKGHAIVLNVVSKSGTTTETIANFQVLLHVLKQYKPADYHEYVVATTDKGSKLWALAQQENFTCLEIPKNVGGRFSVFSPVGLFPLGMIGIDINQLVEGAQSVLPSCVNSDIANNYAALSAAVLFTQYKKNVRIHDTFLFSNDLQGIGAWYRQLVGESIGKQCDKKKKEVRVGITPTVSVGSTDLHSVGQLYFGGPKNMFTTFVGVHKNKSELPVPGFENFEQLVANIQGKTVPHIMDAILRGTQQAYKSNQLPFIAVTLPEKNPFFVGQFLQYKMVEIIYLGYLLEINPFDQPQVELYKKETRELLANG